MGALVLLVALVAVGASAAWLLLPRTTAPTTALGAPSFAPNASPLIGSVNGQPPALSTPGTSWGTVPFASAGVQFSIPGDWQSVAPDDAHLSLLPPTTLADGGGPEISLTMMPRETLDAVAAPPGTVPMTNLSVAGYRAWETDDAGTLPPVNRYEAVQLPQGVLFAVAYKGPGVDLTPFLEGVLSTIAVVP